MAPAPFVKLDGTREKFPLPAKDARGDESVTLPVAGRCALLAERKAVRGLQPYVAGREAKPVPSVSVPPDPRAEAGNLLANLNAHLKSLIRDSAAAALFGMRAPRAL